MRLVIAFWIVIIGWKIYNLIKIAKIKKFIATNIEFNYLIQTVGYSVVFEILCGLKPMAYRKLIQLLTKNRIINDNVLKGVICTLFKSENNGIVDKKFISESLYFSDFMKCIKKIYEAQHDNSIAPELIQCLIDSVNFPLNSRIVNLSDSDFQIIIPKETLIYNKPQKNVSLSKRRAYEGRIKYLLTIWELQNNKKTLIHIIEAYSDKEMSEEINKQEKALNFYLEK